MQISSTLWQDFDLYTLITQLPRMREYFALMCYVTQEIQIYGGCDK